MRKAKIKIRKKPVRPVRKNKDKFYIYEDYDGNLNKVIQKIDKPSIPLENVYFRAYDDEVIFYYEGPEPEEDFQERLKDYHEKLKKYNEWYNKNKDLIEEELWRRKVIQSEKDKKLAEKKKKQKKSKLKKLKAEIKKLEKEV